MHREERIHSLDRSYDRSSFNLPCLPLGDCFHLTNLMDWIDLIIAGVTDQWFHCDHYLIHPGLAEATLIIQVVSDLTSKWF